MSVVIETTLGDITIDLFIQERPKTCFNFIKLCKIRFYNCCLFHRIERDFIAQTGDPSIDRKKEDDRRFPGGCSIFQKIKGDDHVFFEKEVKPRIKHTKFGTVSMVDNGEGMHGSQFFITLSENLDFLDGHHTVFGEVVEGTDVLLKLNSEISDLNHRPYRDVRITHTVVLEDPFEDPPELKEAVSLPSPEIWPEVFDSERIGVEEAVDETDGKPLEEIEEKIQEKEAKARATILEMVGDLPDADMAPPENVLFVCKLNTVTREEDLEIIFSRFGPIKSCEVIKEAKTGESLQYAFIEFQNKEDCEKAYFKMDNVLIDDRRIHVDFSQSVAKYKWKGKGRGVIIKEDEPHQKSRAQDHQNKSHEDSRRRREDDRRKRRRTRSRSPERSSHHHSSRRHNYRERSSRSRDRKYDRKSSRYSPPRHSSHHKDRRRSRS